MANVDDFFESKWLKAADLQGHEVRANIVRWERVEIGQDRKPAIFFEGKKKGLVLNQTNALRIANAYGKDMDNWTGAEIVLYPDTTQFNGQMVDCLRVRVPGKQADDDSEIPFGMLLPMLLPLAYAISQVAV